MSWPRLLVFIRHGESVGNAMTYEQMVAYDHPTHEFTLTPTGRSQSAHTGRYLAENFGRFDVRFASHYRRAMETSQLLFPGEPVITDERLVEIDRGILHVMTEAQLFALYPHEEVRKRREGTFRFRPLGGENWPDAMLRARSFLNTLRLDYGGASIAIVGHGHWWLCCQMVLESIPVEEALRRYNAHQLVLNASVTWYEARPDGPLKKKDENVIPWECG